MSFLQSLFKKNKPFNYQSDIDTFIEGFDRKHQKKSASQQMEIKKFKPIFYKRDHVVPEEQRPKIWREF